jgi:DNA processing protein
MTEADYYLGFSLSPTIGPKRFISLLSYFDSIEQAWFGSKEEYKDAGITGIYFEKFDTYRNESNAYLINKKEELQNKTIQYIPQSDKLYPKQLLDLEGPPIGLFCKGKSSLLSVGKRVAVVGSRKITSYGKYVTELLSTSLSLSGITIVSGMALGVDAIAHGCAIHSNGKTIAVLGNGVDLPYPRENFDLYQQILKSNGLIISEYPPGMQSVKGSFPSRNRIIAGLSIGVLVTEAGKNSGSLITAHEAKKIQRVVFSVPGSIQSEQSEGTNQLLKEGATIVLEAQDLLKTVGIQASSKIQTIDINELTLDENSKNLLTILFHEPHSRDMLSKKMSLPITDISRIVTTLELKGFVTENEHGLFTVTI